MAQSLLQSQGREPEASPVERFIHAVVEPQRQRLNTWRRVLSARGELITDAKKRRRVTATKLVPRNALPMYSLTRSGTTIGGIDGKYTTLVSHQARKATQSRLILRQYLHASEVPQHPGRVFHATQESTAEQYAGAQSAPITVRPAFRGATQPPIAGIGGHEAFSDAWAKVKEAMSELRSVDRQIEIEPVRTGLVLRVYVVGERAVGAVVRTPFYVIGDGTSNIRELVGRELDRRSSCAYLKVHQPTDPSEVHLPKGVELYDVPAKGALQICSGHISGHATGELSVDVLETVDDSLLSLAVDAMWAFPGLAATAVDILTPSLETAELAAIIDVDPGMDIRQFIYPAYGTQRRPGLAILDNMIFSAGLS